VSAFDRSPPPYDVDGDGQIDALTDALLLLRYAFGFRGSTLIAGRRRPRELHAVHGRRDRGLHRRSPALSGNSTCSAAGQQLGSVREGGLMVTRIEVSCKLAIAMIAGAAAAQPPLLQLPGTAGCVSDTGTGGACADGIALSGVYALALSPDGRHLYLTSANDNSVAVFDRNQQTRALTQKIGAAACISETGSGGSCVDGFALVLPAEVAVSPDGDNVYVVSFVSSSLTMFERNHDTGALAQNINYCIAETGTDPCEDGDALDGASGLALSPDGQSIYVASFNSDAVAIFERGDNGGFSHGFPVECVSEDGTAGTCTDGKALDGAFDLAVSPDGRNVYVASYESDALAVFNRSFFGALTQSSGAAGCVSDTGTGGECADGVALDGIRGVTVSPDGRNVYAVGEVSDSLLIFDRDPATGALSQKAGSAGCISDTGSGGLCADGRELDFPLDVAVSPDGRSVYALGLTSKVVLVFDRDQATGELTQKPGKAGCISETGSGEECADGRALDEARKLAVTDLGPSVYVASYGSSAVDAFDRSPPPYDVDGDGEIEPLTDMLLLMRRAFGFSGATLVASAVDLANCQRCTAIEIETFIDALSP
jgi:DNA-binding beta-propeller fold protein YncE